MRLLVIDVGGTHVKVLATGHKQRVEFQSGPEVTLAKVVKLLRTALEADYVVLGGGNARLLKELPPASCLGGNANAFRGGYRLWSKTRSRLAEERFVH